VLFEVLILAFNKFKCPLTGIAARYTSDRKDNFDIYLPLWLTRYNKEIFSALYCRCHLYNYYVVDNIGGQIIPNNVGLYN
jgi:hypothetical protein